MSRNEERDLFLRYIVDTYLKNPHNSVSHDIIYNELSRFCVCNDEHYIIDNDSLVGVQVGLNNKFRNNKSVNTFSSKDGYFLAIENRGNKSDQEYLNDMYNSVKIYVSVDLDNIYKVAESLFNFMINEGIVMQCKIAKGMRNDALVCRVSGKEAAIKVRDYLNGLNYHSKFKPNPFALSCDKASFAMDGKLSYNRVLSKLLAQYFEIRKNSKQLNDVNSDDFNVFIKMQINMFSGDYKKSYMDLYGINDGEKIKDFIMICNLLSKNIEDSLSLEELFKYNQVKDIDVQEQNLDYSVYDEDKILYVINALTNYDSVDDVHKIIMNYIKTGDIKSFTRKDDIRNIIYDNFTSNDVKNIISDLGWRALIQVSKITYDKYGEDQLFVAIKNLFSDGNIKYFTNDYSSRSRLGLVIPPELLKSVIVNKLEENGMNISTVSLTQLIMEEINKLEDKKKISRK